MLRASRPAPYADDTAVTSSRLNAMEWCFEQGMTDLSEQGVTVLSKQGMTVLSEQGMTVLSGAGCD